MSLAVDPAELDQIIAALRHWQQSFTIPLAIMEIACGDRGNCLEDEAIDDLIERINCE